MKSGTVPITNANELTRSGEYRCSSGAAATEYQAQVAVAASASATPQMCVETAPLEPSATSAAPAAASPPASQKRRQSRSIPSTNANRPASTGSVPNTSATVVAVVSLIA